jgi:hypothetical protein
LLHVNSRRASRCGDLAAAIVLAALLLRGLLLATLRSLLLLGWLLLPAALLARFLLTLLLLLARILLLLLLALVRHLLVVRHAVIPFRGSLLPARQREGRRIARAGTGTRSSPAQAWKAEFRHGGTVAAVSSRC